MADIFLSSNQSFQGWNCSTPHPLGQRVSRNPNIQMGQFFCNSNWFSSIVFMADLRFSGTSDHKTFFYNMFVCQTPIKSCGLSETVTLAGVVHHVCMWCYTSTSGWCGVTPAPVYQRLSTLGVEAKTSPSHLSRCMSIFVLPLYRHTLD